MKSLIFVLKAFGLGLLSLLRLDGRRNIPSVKSSWSILHSELKVHILPPTEVNKKIKH